jgi:hypothetical protein
MAAFGHPSAFGPPPAGAGSDDTRYADPARMPPSGLLSEATDLVDARLWALKMAISETQKSVAP